MVVIQRVVKATTRRGKKVLLRREPQVLEGPKRTLFLQGRRSSDRLRALTKDLYNLKKPDGRKLDKKHDISVFEDAGPVEQFCRKYDAALFVLSSHSKKRPNNLTLGRLFDEGVLDMVELGVENVKVMGEFRCEKALLGAKPCLVFNGPQWEESEELKHLKSLLVDLFHRETVDCVRLQGLEHSISFTVTDEKKILIRSYRISMKKSGESVPRVELTEMGPHIDLSLRRSKLPTEDLMKQAVRQPKELKVTKRKNVSVDGLGTKHGRIHVGKQQIEKLQTRKMKGLKKSAGEKKMERKRGNNVKNGVNKA